MSRYNEPDETRRSRYLRYLLHCTTAICTGNQRHPAPPSSPHLPACNLHGGPSVYIALILNPPRKRQYQLPPRQETVMNIACTRYNESYSWRGAYAIWLAPSISLPWRSPRKKLQSLLAPSQLHRRRRDRRNGFRPIHGFTRFVCPLARRWEAALLSRQLPAYSIGSCWHKPRLAYIKAVSLPLSAIVFYSGSSSPSPRFMVKVFHKQQG